MVSSPRAPSFPLARDAFGTDQGQATGRLVFEEVTPCGAGDRCARLRVEGTLVIRPVRNTGETTLTLNGTILHSLTTAFPTQISLTGEGTIVEADRVPQGVPIATLLRGRQLADIRTHHGGGILRPAHTGASLAKVVAGNRAPLVFVAGLTVGAAIVAAVLWPRDPSAPGSTGTGSTGSVIDAGPLAEGGGPAPSHRSPAVSADRRPHELDAGGAGGGYPGSAASPGETGEVPVEDGEGAEEDRANQARAGEAAERRAGGAGGSPTGQGSVLFARSRVTGRVKIEGPLPEPMPIDMRADPECTRLGGGVTDDYRGKDGGLADVLIFVEQAPRGENEPILTPVVIDQVKCRYVPKVLGVMVKQPLDIVNSDPTLHNIHPQGVANEFNVGLPPRGQRITRSFRKPEVFVPVKCDVHPWMKAWIGVFDHPFFAVSDEDGSYTLAGLPDGVHWLIARHPLLGEQRVNVDLHGGAATADFHFTSPR